MIIQQSTHTLLISFRNLVREPDFPFAAKLVEKCRKTSKSRFVLAAKSAKNQGGNGNLGKVSKRREETVQSGLWSNLLYDDESPQWQKQRRMLKKPAKALKPTDVASTTCIALYGHSTCIDQLERL